MVLPCEDQVLIFQHFQNTTNGFAGAADDLADFLTGDFDLHPIRVQSWHRAVSPDSAAFRAMPGDVKEGEVTYFSEVTCVNLLIWGRERASEYPAD